MKTRCTGKRWEVAEDEREEGVEEKGLGYHLL